MMNSPWFPLPPCSHKAAVIEPRESSQFGAATAAFQAKLDSPAYKGAIFFAVCR